MATDLPEHSIRPLIPTAESPQSFFQQKPHLKTTREFSHFFFLFYDPMEEQEHALTEKHKRLCFTAGEEAFSGEFEFRVLTTTARSSPRLFRSQPPTSLSLRIQVPGDKFPACHPPPAEEVVKRERKKEKGKVL